MSSDRRGGDHRVHVPPRPRETAASTKSQMKCAIAPSFDVIEYDLNGKPVITTTPVELESTGDTWTLKIGDAANFFRVRLTNE